MAGCTTLVDEEKAMLRMRLSNLEDTISHLQYIKAQTAATHQHEVATLQDRINGRPAVVFPQLPSLMLIVFSVLERELSGGSNGIENLEQGIDHSVILAEHVDHPVTNIRNGEILDTVKNNDDIVMFGCDIGAGGVDFDAVVDQAGDGNLHGGINMMGDSDDDTSSEGAPGPAAWLAFQYVIFFTYFFHQYISNFCFH